ncbi:MAG: NTP transferase domain-containing protein, partial [Muribaculaceae bacterium]|nr:NTP transferase domain-containing protein [Muribaculaceae bacterium]
DLSGEVMTLVVTDSDGHLLGTVTDGDIRRALIRGTRPEGTVSEVMNKAYTALTRPDNVQAIRQARARGIRLLPVVDSDGRVERLLDLTQQDTVLPLSAILMAGGKGERLRPMTLETPKPLLRIDGRPIIDYNIRNLARAGITDVSVTVRYLAEQIEEHFARPVCGISVRCVHEEQPLGTIGSAALVSRDPRFADTLVMNSDLLTNVSLEEMYLRHAEEKADVTIAAIPYTLSVPYAILATDGPRVTALSEKPTYSHLANAGIYIFSNRLLDTLPTDTRTDATDLIEKAIAEGLKVVHFPLNGTWIDIGSPADFRHAEELMRHHREWLA